MKNNIKIFGILLVISSLFLSACHLGSGESYSYEYYKGALPNTYYLYNYWGERCMQITGKPWLVMKYHRLDHQVLDFSFGFSEVTQVAVSGVTGGTINEPTIDESSIFKSSKLGLSNPCVLLVDMPVSAWGESIETGTLATGEYTFTYSGLGTKYSFTYLPAGDMWGGMESIWGDGGSRDTDLNTSIQMLRL